MFTTQTDFAGMLSHRLEGSILNSPVREHGTQDNNSLMFRAFGVFPMYKRPPPLDGIESFKSVSPVFVCYEAEWAHGGAPAGN